MNYEEAKALESEFIAMYKTGNYDYKNGTSPEYDKNVWIKLGGDSDDSFTLDLTFFLEDNDNFAITIYEFTKSDAAKELTRIAKQLLNGEISWELGNIEVGDML